MKTACTGKRPDHSLVPEWYADMLLSSEQRASIIVGVRQLQGANDEFCW
jgi:hypothetical protein